MRHRLLAVSVAFSILMVSLTYALSGRMGFGMFPKVESDYSLANVVLPFGSPVEKTEAVMEQLLEGTRRVVEKDGREELVTSITSDVGESGAHTGRMRVSLAPPEVRDKVLGIVGYGHIGQQVGILAEALGMRVVFFDMIKRLPLGNSTQLESMDELLSRADFITLHVPAKPDGTPLIGTFEISKMK